MGHKLIEIPSTGYLTASQVGTPYGCGFGTPLEMYNRYKGIEDAIKEPTDEAKARMEFGTRFEEAVAQFFTYKTGLKVKRMGEGKMAWWADDMPYFICHPDRIGIGRDSKGRRFALEIKCVAPFAEGWGEEWTDQVPDHYYLQVQSYFACKVPCDVVYMAVMKGNKVLFYEIIEDADVTADIRSRIKRIKDDFDAGIIPNPANYDEAKSYFGRKVNPDDGYVGANDDVLAKYKQLLDIQRRSNDLEDEAKEIKAELMKKLDDHPGYVTVEGKDIKRIIYWTTETRSSFDMARFKKDNPDIDTDAYATSKTIRKFNVSYPRDKKEG